MSKEIRKAQANSFNLETSERNKVTSEIDEESFEQYLRE